METPPQPRWLNVEEMETWHALAGVMIRLPSALDTQLQRDAGISHMEYLVMTALSQSDERTLRMSELAANAGSSLSRLSHLVKRLEKSDWVRRAPDPEDGRYTLATLTDAGYAKVVDTAPGHVEAVRRYVFDALTKAQQRQLKDIGQRIWSAVAPNDRCRFKG
ncbi:MarR family transcriptional regulator [Streptomyces ipomoeae]|jgi:DNA-binding MarR family transcriptional regulator|uniref:Transcriptional regulator, MarR family n=2 Tax=Streptomyces ipomoeae TaxID=103232 RepID=L1KQC9_9ACTN|nr:MarR family transcriptional regulator [Streptomyces ipomoeae]EKX62700.1 transcriptional regulator, MarR family [Streptomyces ipomoeae 91-03]MDX2694523.1 MarR family transcriptional regulator [Streptomyces ipomoeae]MDX2822396.1 MarR family transcriptional regulator [Streptomyces ipomoeae]MDX2840104.1 MarR family transcriptional regulator [Streptomyces ipomoeae]MDX2877669.1 MarR family transcriptional regulator [Streptomyces ipomoeae]